MVNYDIKNIYQWPMQAKLVVIVVISITLLVVLYVIDIRSYKAEIQKNITNQEDLKRQLKTMLDKQITIKANISQLPALKSQLQKWQEKMFTKDEMPNALNEVIKTGQANRLKITSFNPADEIKDGVYFKTPVNIDMAGTYDQIARFISQLANMPKMINIDAFTIKRNPSDASIEPGPVDSQDILLANIDIEIYRK